MGFGVTDIIKQEVNSVNLLEILNDAIGKNASDIFLIAGTTPTYKIDGIMVHIGDNILTPPETELLVNEIYEVSQNRDMTRFNSTGDDDFSFSIPSLGRMRVNVFRQRGSYAVVIRIIKFELPDPVALSIPAAVMDFVNYQRGLVLVTGPAGSGKSTTLACLIDKINIEQSKHIITMEDPIEYIHPHKKSIVSQREISTDTKSYLIALRAALRQSPNIIQLGEMRDSETITVAMTAAETGQLLFSTLHTVGAANTIDRIIDVFPVNQQNQIRVQLSMVLQAVVSQQLIPSTCGKLVAAFEIMKVNVAIRNLIRESKIHQIDSAIFAGGNDGMCTMDMSIHSLYQQGIITAENALKYCVDYEWMSRRLTAK